MTGYSIVNLAEALKLQEESRTIDDEEAQTRARDAFCKIQEAISTFYCPQNPDVEQFLKAKAFDFAKQGITATYLIFAPYKGHPALVGYFALANKYMFVPKQKIDSRTWRQRISKFGQYNDDMKGYQLSIPLIAQLGKNFHNDYNKLISGDELLKLACDKVKQIQIMLSGKLTYVECEDKECLIQFYTANGFRRIANRYLSKAERRENDNPYLVQLIKYIKKSK